MLSWNLQSSCSIVAGCAKMFAPEGAVQALVRGVHRRIQEPLPGAGKLGDAEHGTEILDVERALIGVRQVEPGEQRTLGRPSAARALRSADMNASFCAQSELMMTIWLATQLCPLLCSRWVATCSA